MAKTLSIREAEEYLGWPPKSLANHWREYQAQGMLKVIKKKPWQENSRICVSLVELEKFIGRLERESR